MRWLLVSTAALVALPGCRNHAQLDAHLELMNAERRALEDELYQLEYEFESTAQELENTRSENQRLRGQLGGAADDVLDSSPGDRGGPNGIVPEVELAPPTVDPGVPSTRADQEGSGGSPLTRQQVSLRQRFNTASSGSADITHIYIDPALTRGSDFDGRPGDDGITLVIEPRDDTGSFVPEAGAVSVVLLDYANRALGPAARVARWDLDATETAELLFDTERRRGIQLELKWPGRPPEHRRLRLDVRFETADGRLLETRQDIQINTGQDTANSRARPDSRATPTPSGWTPRAVNRSKDEGEVATLQPSGKPPQAGPWSLEQAAGDAIRQDRSSPADQRAARPQWRPYR